MQREIIVATTFRSSDNMDALSCTDPSLNVCCAVGSWDHNVCRKWRLNCKCSKCSISGLVWYFKWFQHLQVLFITSCGDDPLHINSGFLQEVDRQAAGRAGASHAHADLPRHHGDRGWLDGPDTCHGLVIGPCHGTPENRRDELVRCSHTHTEQPSLMVTSATTSV